MPRRGEHRRKSQWRLGAAENPNAGEGSNRNTAQGNNEYPRLLEIENVGDEATQSVEWEIRDYYATLPRSYESRRGKRLAPVKPEERFVIDVGSESADVALLTHFEIIMSHMGLNRAKFFSHFTVDGDVERNDVGLNRARWALTLPLVRVWVRHFLAVVLQRLALLDGR
jgi:hypothetical protein